MRRTKSFVFFIILLLFFSTITTLYTQAIEPLLIQFTQAHAYTLAMNCTEEAIRKKTKDVTYNSIISCVTDENGKIVALQANTNELNRISNELAIGIEENISKIDNTSIKIPLGMIFNTGIFGGMGVKVNIKTLPLGDTKIDCISEFDTVGINQTRHRIVLKVKTYFTVIAPVYLKNECYEKDVILAETILSGNIPQTYYNLDMTDKSNLINLP